MPCNIAAWTADGREIFATEAFPNVMRWDKTYLKLIAPASDMNKDVFINFAGNDTRSAMTLENDRNVKAY